MKEIELVIKISKEVYGHILKTKSVPDVLGIDIVNAINAIKSGIPLPKGHGRLIDVGKIDEDRIDHDNPIIYLSMNGEYIEAVSLNYINNLPTIIEADYAESEEE